MTPTQVKKVRPCLRCDEPINSTPEIRMCIKCKIELDKPAAYHETNKVYYREKKKKPLPDSILERWRNA